MRFITKTQEYKTLQNSKHLKYLTKHFVILYKYTESNELAVGITVSAKVGNAVRRNLIKRRIKAYFRDFYKFDIKNLKINIIAKRNAFRLTWEKVVEELTLFFSYINDDENI